MVTSTITLKNRFPSSLPRPIPWPQCLEPDKVQLPIPSLEQYLNFVLGYQGTNFTCIYTFINSQPGLANQLVPPAMTEHEVATRIIVEEAYHECDKSNSREFSKTCERLRIIHGHD